MKRRRRVAVLAVRVAGVLFLISQVAPPIVAKLGWTNLAATLDLCWEPLCHRMPERTLSLFGYLMPLCSRCFGMGAGMAIGVEVARPVVFTKLWPLLGTLLVTGVAMLAEIATQDAGWHPVFHPTRLLTGFAFGFPVGAATGALLDRWVAAEKAEPMRA